MNIFSFNYKKYQNVFFLLLIILPAVFLGLGEHELLLPDEPREAEIAREMWVSKNFAVPTLNGEAFLEKPPLFYWSVVAVFGIAGKANAFLARVPSAFFGFGILLFTYAIASKLFGQKIGLASALITCTTKEFIHRIHKCMIDASLAFFIIGTLYFFLSGYQSEKRKSLNFYFMYVMMGLSFLSKGLIGVVIPCSVIFVFLLFEKNIQVFRELRIWKGIVIFLIVISPWLFLLWLEGSGKYFNIFFIDNHWDRFFYASLGHKASFYYYFIKIFDVLFPWSFFLPLMIYKIFKERNISIPEKRKEILFAKSFAFIPFLVMSFSSTKRGLYLLPIIPAFSMLIACCLEKEFLKKFPSYPVRITGRILTAVALIGMFVAIAITIWNKGINPEPIVGLIMALFLAVMAVRFLSKNEFQKLFISIAVCLTIMFSPYFAYETEEETKSFYALANTSKDNISDINNFRAITLSEHEKGIGFYLNRIIPEDKSLDAVRKNLLSEKSVSYIVRKESLDKIHKELPAETKVKYIGFTGRHSYFLLSNRS